ncbi:MAG: glycosyltransferase family 2 protein, partial [Proteobacteria bacterium]|nr:glycosyltransferase family 2 protein [Pseudomonadota bacterium]
MPNIKILPIISISIVSHNQATLVAELLYDIKKLHLPNIEIIVTFNIDEKVYFCEKDFSFPIIFIKNKIPKGFSANHNAAFNIATGEIFCVLNPDIRLINNPFESLIKSIKNPNIGVVGPLVIKPNGNIEDSARHFPNPLTILLRVLSIKNNEEYSIGSEPIYPDWIAGMFMLFRRDIYWEIGGFDERYFLYVEDVDICIRIKLINKIVMLDPRATIIHKAQRNSKKSF